MKKQILGLRTASVVFGLLALVQLSRIIMQPQVFVAGRLMPLWPSTLAVLVLGSLCVWLARLSAPHGHKKFRP